MRVLIIDNNLDTNCWGAQDLRRLVVSVLGTTAYVRRGPHDDLPDSLAQFDRIILSGSRTSCLDEALWIDHLDELILKAIRLSKPVLGICFGHQALIRAIGGRSALRRGTTPEFGWTRIEILTTASLFEGLPQFFYSFSSHYEEVARLPPGMRLLAKSKGCAVQACQLDGYPIFGVQFHPEKDLFDANKSLEERRKKKDSEILLHPDNGHELFDPKVGEKIFGNFLSL
jgi:GMP synthase-like glutamine amidotransferase